MVDPYTWLKSEKAELERFLQNLPEDDIFMRPGFEHRLREVEAELEKLEKPHDGYEIISLLFEGRPVLDSHGIQADFAAEAVESFSKSLKSISAALSGKLKERGRIPEGSAGRVFITDTQRGSFGFRLMLDNLPAAETADAFSSLGEAVKRLLAIFQSEGDQDKVSEIVEEIHPRAARDVGKFLSILSRNEARPKVIYRGKLVAPGKDVIKTLADLLSEKSLNEEDISATGHLLGVLPKSRQFEFQIAHEDGEGEIIKGKISDVIENPADIYEQFHGQPVCAQFHLVRVGSAKPRYTLVSVSGA